MAGATTTPDILNRAPTDYQAESCNVSRPGIASSVQLDSTLPSFDGTMSASVPQIELESSRESLQDAKLHHFTANMSSSSATSTVIYTPESSIEPWIKKVNSPSDHRNITLSLPKNSQDYRNSFAVSTIPDHRNDIEMSNRSDMPQIKSEKSIAYTDRHLSSVVREHHEQLHCLEVQNRQRKLIHESLKFESIDSKEHLRSIPTFKSQADTGYEVTGLPDEDMKPRDGIDTIAQEEKMKEEENLQSIRSPEAQSPHGSESTSHTATKASTRRPDYHPNDLAEMFDRFARSRNPGETNYQIQLMLCEARNRKTFGCEVSRQDEHILGMARLYNERILGPARLYNASRLNANEHPCPLSSCSRQDHAFEDIQSSLRPVVQENTYNDSAYSMRPKVSQTEPLGTMPQSQRQSYENHSSIDYQMQLVLLEEQNEKRRRMAEKEAYELQLAHLEEQNEKRRRMAEEEAYQHQLVLLEEQNKKRRRMAEEEECNKRLKTQ